MFKKYIIDDVIQLIPTQSSFKIEPLLEKVLVAKNKFKKRDDLDFVQGVSIIEEVLLSYNLAKEQTDKTFLLTDRGVLSKELGGFTKFLKHRRQELNALSIQRKINIGLLIIGLLGILSPFLSEWSKHKYFKDESLKQPIHVVIDTVTITTPLNQPEKEQKKEINHQNEKH